MSTPQKAYLQTETGIRLDCLFNPAKLEVVLESSWEGRQIPGQHAPAQRFGGGQSGRIPGLELLFDTTDSGTSVTTYTDALAKLLRIDEDLPGYDASQQHGRPAWVQFHWGSFHSFKAVVTRLAISFTYFSPSGEPLRALATMDLTQYEDEADYPRQNPTSGTPMPARSHQVQPGETLDRIAAAHYDDPTQWRRLAAANDIRDPFALSPGTRIDIPRVED
ncbi:MAG: LysM peptidoglycan-binding domain-containing protein [Nitriliruptoraceae bacterium]|nr:LysM peptidoglycan-binding domain-containing protein [Nitriliruptoraceae bacterium]